MELLDMSGFIDRITYWDYGAFVHTSEPGHFSRLACGEKWVIENPPWEGLASDLFLLFFSVGAEDFFMSNFKEPPLFIPHFCLLSFSPSFFTRCREIHYEAAPFFFVLPHWWRERRDRPSRIDNERGDWRWKREEQKKKEELKTDGKVERDRSRRRQRLGRQITKNRELTGIFQNPLGELESLSNLSVLCWRLVSAMGRGGVRIYTRGGTWAGD